MASADATFCFLRDKCHLCKAARKDKTCDKTPYFPNRLIRYSPSLTFMTMFPFAATFKCSRPRIDRKDIPAHLYIKILRAEAYPLSAARMLQRKRVKAHRDVVNLFTRDKPSQRFPRKRSSRSVYSRIRGRLAGFRGSDTFAY